MEMHEVHETLGSLEFLLGHGQSEDHNTRRDDRQHQSDLSFIISDCNIHSARATTWSP